MTGFLEHLYTALYQVSLERGALRHLEISLIVELDLWRSMIIVHSLFLLIFPSCHTKK